jgi:hypothetical protein
MRMKFNNTHVYKIRENEHLFHSVKDAEYWCEQHNIPKEEIEKFDSAKEYRRWLELQQWQADGKITDLQRQVEYEIIPEASEDVLDHYKKAKCYVIKCEYEPFEIKVLWSKKEALQYCKDNEIAKNLIEISDERIPIYKHKVIESKAVYTADFVYKQDDKLVVEDCKSDITRKEPDYVLRRKLMLYRYKIKILETL